MYEYNNLIKNIVDASKNRKLVFFVGAGLSKISKYPNWEELVNRFYKELYGKTKSGGIYGNEYLQIPQMFYDVKKEESYNEILREVFNVDKEPNNVHYKILALNPVHILTTNYDDLIEKASLDRGRHFSRISCNSHVSTTSSNRYLVKVHGDFSNGFNAENIVLKERDYMEYEDKFPLVSNLMKSIMATHTVVFIGYGLGDYNINLLINWVKRLQEKEDATSFFIRGDHDPIEENVRIYYEEKGFKIIDSTQLVESEKDDYDKRYLAVLDKILNWRECDIQLNDEKVIELVHEKISPLYSLNAIRKSDLNIVFDYDYQFAIDGTISKNKAEGFSYIERFFEIENQEVEELPLELFEKYNTALQFLRKNGVQCMRENAQGKILEITQSIDNAAYHSDFEEMKKIINSTSVSPVELYEQAFYLASYGKWDEAYDVYSSLLRKTDSPEHRMLHYLTLLNRYWVYQAIKQSTKYFDTIGILTHGKRYQPFTNDFLIRMNIEMENFDIKDVFNDMPNKYQEKFKSLKYLGDPKFLYDDIIKLNELTRKAQSSIRKSTITLGGLTPFHEVQIRLNDILKFVYENKLWISSFSEVKDFTRNAMRMLFENARYDSTKEPGEFDFNSGANHDNYYIDYYDYVNICKSFTKEEVEYAESISNIGSFDFRDSDKIEEYITRITNEFIKNYSGDGMNIILNNIIINEAKNAIYFAKYTKLSQKCVLKIFNMLLNYFPLTAADYGDRYFWMYEILANNVYPLEATSMIESFLIEQLVLLQNPKYIERSTSKMFSWNFAHIIKVYNSEFQSTKLSEMALKVKKDNKRELRYFYHLLDILNPKAKEYIISLKGVDGIGDFLVSVDLGIVGDLDKSKDQIIKLLDERIAEIKTDQENRITRRYWDDFPLTVAIWKYLGYIDDSRLLSYLGIIDEYDMLVNPEGFDFEKFKPRWLKKYPSELLEKISKDERIKDKVLTHLIERVKMTHDKRYIEIVFEFFI